MITALAAGLGVNVTTSTPAQAADSAGVDAPLYDPGPPWAPDYGLMCKILERYGDAHEHVCPVEPINSVGGPN